MAYLSWRLRSWHQRLSTIATADRRHPPNAWTVLPIRAGKVIGDEQSGGSSAALDRLCRLPKITSNSSPAWRRHTGSSTLRTRREPLDGPNSPEHPGQPPRAPRPAVFLAGGARTVRQSVHLTTVGLVVTAFAVPATSGRAALALPVLLSLGDGRVAVVQRAVARRAARRGRADRRAGGDLARAGNGPLQGRSADGALAAAAVHGGHDGDGRRPLRPGCGRLAGGVDTPGGVHAPWVPRSSRLRAGRRAARLVRVSNPATWAFGGSPASGCAFRTTDARTARR